MARSGLRMMPTFPLPSLKFRTAGFPSTASRPVGQTRPSRATQPSRRAVCLRPWCSPLPSSDPRSVPGDVARWNTSVRAAAAALPQGPSLRSEFFCPGPSTLNRTHPPHSQAHPDFTAMRLIPDAFAVHTTPRRPPSGSTLSLPILLDMPSSTTPRRSQPVGSRHAVPIGLRHVMSGSALPTILPFRGFLVRLCCGLASCSPLCRSDQSSSGHRDFYLQASDESVTLLAAGYNYDSHWTVLSKGLSPFGMTTSVAAP
jgi:hypothetical protein